MLWRYVYRYILNFTRVRSLRELALIIATFMCISLYLTTYLFDTSPTLQRTIFNDGMPWNFQQLSARNILSQYSSLNNSNTINRLNSVASFAASGYQSVSNKRLEKLLREMEEKTQLNGKYSKLALIRGQRSVISRDFALYRWALERHKFSIDAPNWLRSKRRASTETAQNLTDLTDWLILICLAFTDGDGGVCLQTKDFQILKSHQRVNRIPGLRNLLWKKDSFCSTMSEARKVPLIMKSVVLSPLCFVMPTQYQQFIDVAEALGYSAQWLLKPIGIDGRHSGTGPQFINIFTNEGRDRLREYTTKRAVIQQYVSNPLRVFGLTVNLRIYVIVTSIEPLRAYVHNEGLVYHRYEEDRNYKRMSDRTWMLSQFWRYVTKNFGAEKMKKAVNKIHGVILDTLLIAEAMLIAQRQSMLMSNNINSADRVIYRRCDSCFHLMAFDIILNSTLDPFILEVNGQPNMQQSKSDESPNSGKVKRLVLDDTISLISATVPVANDVAEALEEVIGDNIGVMGISCHISHDLCLSNADLSYLLQTRREALSKQGFKNLYPALGIDNIIQLIGELNNMIAVTRVAHSSDSSVHKTADLHSLLMSLEKYYYRHLIDEEFGDSAGNFLDQTTNFSSPSTVLSAKNEFDSSVINECSDDPLTLPYLANIELNPNLQLMPPFSPFVTQYNANASYEQLLISVSAKAHNCQSEVRLDDKYGSSRSTNYTLGIGINKISFIVVDISHTEPWVINTYTLIINRLPITHNTPQFRPYMPHSVCSFTQDCDMRVFERNSCGITREANYIDWRMYLYSQSLTKICDSGSQSGRWALPCVSCDNKSSCFWHEVRWDPYNCHYPSLSHKQLSKCLTNKKILFVGDSTNRGMMHYLIEKLNGTLVDWDKTHDLKIYPNMNRGKTLISFAYYPKFWLPTNQRPSFDKAVYQLFEKIKTYENSTNTILIFGGVQWLATQHIHMLLKTLSNLKLQGIKLVMKTLGAGFHQHIEGVHCLSLEEHQKLAQRNAALTAYAMSLGIEVIDTYNITIARYKDFLPGKCACHFHTVTEIETSDTNSGQISSESHYKVEGPINAIYTDVLISRICDESTQQPGVR